MYFPAYKQQQMRHEGSFLTKVVLWTFCFWILQLQPPWGARKQHNAHSPATLCSSCKTYSQLLCPPWHCFCPLAIDNPAFHFQHLTASFGLTHRSGKQLFWDSLVSSVAFYAPLFSEQEMSMGSGRLKGKQGDWKRGEENVYHEFYRMGRREQQLQKTVKGEITGNLPGEVINQRVFLQFLGCAGSVHYYLYKFTPESFKL